MGTLPADGDADAHEPEGKGEGEDEDERRYLVVDGRRWRRADPAIPEPLAHELVAELMDARRAVRAARGEETATAAARRRVQDAKVALGERGHPWWEPTEEGRRDRLAAAMRTLLRQRAADKTICPSDAARVAGGAQWRGVLDQAREVAYALADEGVLEVRQRGAKVDGRAVRGPIRLARGPRWPG